MSQDASEFPVSDIGDEHGFYPVRLCFNIFRRGVGERAGVAGDVVERGPDYPAGLPGEAGADRADVDELAALVGGAEGQSAEGVSVSTSREGGQDDSFGRSPDGVLDPTRVPSGAVSGVGPFRDDAFDLGRWSINARRLSVGARPRLADGLGPADQDLGKRLLGRPDGAQWWTLALANTALESGTGYGVQKVFPPPGALEPILVDPVGKPVVAAWIPAHQNQRWYIVPDAIKWASVIDWLVQQAIPYYIPDAPRRFRTAGFVDPAWETPREQRAREAIAAMEIRHLEERARLEAEREDARRAAEGVRDGLLWGSGGELVRAVEQVLSDAGISTIDLDASEKGTWSADLLASAAGPARLIEVKSEGGRAKEALVGDLVKHLGTWRTERPEEPVSGGTLIVNYQRKIAPVQREPHVYSRQEFVKSLTVKVVGSIDLFRWWKDSDWPAIREAVLGETTPPRDDCSAAHATPDAPAAPQRRGGWFRRHRRSTP